MPCDHAHDRRPRLLRLQRARTGHQRHGGTNETKVYFKLRYWWEIVEKVPYFILFATLSWEITRCVPFLWAWLSLRKAGLTANLPLCEIQTDLFLADLVLKSKKHLFSSSLPPPFHTSALDSFPNLPFLYISRREKRPSFLFRLSFLGWKGKGVILHSFRCTYSLGLPIKLRHSAALRKSRISAGHFWREGAGKESFVTDLLKF